MPGQTHRLFLKWDTLWFEEIEDYYLPNSPHDPNRGHYHHFIVGGGSRDRLTCVETTLSDIHDIDVFFATTAGTNSQSYVGYAGAPSYYSALYYVGALETDFLATFNAGTNDIEDLTPTPTLTVNYTFWEKATIDENGCTGVGNWYYKVVLANEYTTPMVIEDALNQVSFPGSWSSVSDPVSQSISSSLSLSSNEQRADVNVTQWKATIPDTELDQEYEISWEERFTPDGGSPGVWVPQTMRVVGTGGSVSHVETVPLPAQSGSTEVRIKSVRPVAGEIAGPGSGGARGMGGDCRSCAGGGAQGFFGPEYSMAMGHDAMGFGAGALSFSASDAGAWLTNPRALRWNRASSAGSGLESFRSLSGAVAQVATPHALANVVPRSAGGYEVRFYAAAARGSRIDSNQGYAILSGHSPTTTYRIDSPDGVDAVNRVRVTRNPGAGEQVWLYERQNLGSTGAGGNGVTS
jgi:hypothetical protein